MQQTRRKRAPLMLDVMSNKRRTEKAWRFRDRETSGSQSLYDIFVSLQGIIIGIFAILSAPIDTIITASFLAVVFVLGAITMLVLLFLSVYSRDLDHRRACYFEITSQPQDKWPPNFDHRKEHNDWKADYKKYLKWRVPLESIAAFCFLANLFLLWLAIHKYLL